MIGQVAQLVRRREASCVELVERALRLVEAGNQRNQSRRRAPREQALAEAARQDRQLAAGEEFGPLTGVPALVKDLADVAGMVTT